MARWPLNQVDRFWSQVKKAEGDGCWEWVGAVGSAGYGRVHFDGRLQQAQRVAWELTNGPIPGGLWALHKCDNPKCIRPDHLFLGTCQDNWDDCRRKKRQAYGERNGCSKLTTEQALAIKSDPRRHRIIAKAYGIDQSSVTKLKRGQRWIYLQHENLGA